MRLYATTERVGRISGKGGGGGERGHKIVFSFSLVKTLSLFVKESLIP